MSSKIEIRVKIIDSIFGLLLGFSVFGLINLTYGQENAYCNYENVNSANGIDAQIRQLQSDKIANPIGFTDEDAKKLHCLQLLKENKNVDNSVPISQAGNSVYDKECGTNIPNNGAAKEFLTIMNNEFGPDAEEAGPELKETYDCVNEIYEQETGNNIKTQLDDQYDCKDPIDCLSEAMLRDQREGGIDDDGDGEGSDDKDDNDPNVQ
ncbi:MAG: hypothetical protein AB7U98_15145 [Candidatus Nitrosocosmicus sp.]|jgi:hypothetical protein